MRYCHECGAEVAPEDIFCLYCGITLQPVSVVSEEDETGVPSGDLPNETETGNVTEQTEVAAATPIVSDKLPAAVDVQVAAAAPEEILATDSRPENQSEEISSEISGEIAINAPGEQVAAFAAPAVVENNQNLTHSNDNAVLDEDLQPTLIGHSAKIILLADENANTPPSTTQASENPAVSSSDLSLELLASDEEPEEIADESVSSSASLEIPQPETSGEQSTEPPPAGQTADRLVQPETDKSASQIAMLAPRQTEANRAQETPTSGKSPKLKPLNIGTLLNNRYKVVRRIGGGGMGAVYLAEDQNLSGVLRAVKEMIQAYVDESQQEKAVADFRRESVLLTQLEHPSIPTIYDYFFDEINGRFYLVMKYISGGDLAARLRAAPEGKLDEGSVTTWAIQIADVLDYLHNRQPPIVYRDLKPSNIMLDGKSNKAMLIDFGIARWVNKEEKGVTAVGTMGYAPPELFAGNAEPRSDIYSLGATMFHLLTGADPQSNPLLIFDFTKNPKPRQINLMLSVEMEDILLRSVEYNSGLRFESAAKMRDALSEHLERLKAGRLTFERTSHNLAQVMPIPAQAPPSVPFASQPAVNMVFCGFCGEKIIGTDMFCAYCGAPQAATGADGQPPQFASAQQQMQKTMLSSNPLQSAAGGVTARLVVLGTSELDAPLFKLEKETNLVGREDRRANIFPEVDLSKFDNKAQVSRRHARIWREGSAYMVEDLKSSNGTVLITDDNQTVRLQANQPHVLQHGDKLKLGDTTLRFYVN